MSERGLEMWRKSQCCGGAPEQVVQVDIYGDGRVIGLVGLTTIFEQLHVLAARPMHPCKLVKMVAAKNYVPVKDEPIYGAALVREYANFCAKKKKQEQ